MRAGHGGKLGAALVAAAALCALCVASGAQIPRGKGRPMVEKTETITLGGGCFWCIEAVFQELKGVEKVESGYSGGTVPNPAYEQVCTGRTGHAEVVQITFDPALISLAQILEVFFAVHDPTTPNRQGADVGPQYRSVIFYRSPEQRVAAEEAIRKLEAAKLYPRPVVTQVEPFQAFYKAENYHQEYYRLHGEEPYCQLVISPKMKKFREHFRALLGRK
jgi:peptide-methionine (S)-S-oxide reductase